MKFRLNQHRDHLRITSFNKGGGADKIATKSDTENWEQPKNDITYSKYFHVYISLTRFSLLCISCGSEITKRNKKNTSKRLSTPASNNKNGLLKHVCLCVKMTASLQLLNLGVSFDIMFKQSFMQKKKRFFSFHKFSLFTKCHKREGLGKTMMDKGWPKIALL